MKTLKSIYTFLLQNREHNDKLQRYELQKAMFGMISEQEKVISLLYFAFNTQARPNLNLSLEFFKAIVKEGRFQTMEAFIISLYRIANRPEPKVANYKSLFKGMQLQPGWGPKTAALFTKLIYILHKKWDGQLGFWLYAPSEIAADDQLYLPVDEVIKTIFNKLDPEKNWYFDSINQLLHLEFSDTDIEVWDDLWFWGFITQKTEEDERIHEYNAAKLWSLQIFTNRSNYGYSLISERAEEFVSHLISKV